MQLLEILNELGIPTAPEGHRHSTPSRVNIDCPQCSPNSGKFKAGIHREWLSCNCWSCGHLKLTDVLAALSNESWQRVKSLLDSLDKGFVAHEPKPQGKLVLPEGLEPLQSPHRRYLEGRGFDSDELVKLWGIQGIGIHPTLPWRVFIPINHRGETVSWTTRAISEKVSMRYITARKDEEKLSLKSVLYGECFARHAIIVVEGPLDCWRVGPGCVATMGLAFTRKQVEQIVKYPVRVVAYDNEPAAQQTADKLCRLLEDRPGITERVVLSAADPGEATKEEVAELRRRYLD